MDVAVAPSTMGEFHMGRDRAMYGWCWYPDDPAMRATVELLREGKVVRAVRATRPRADLHEPGMSDVDYGFWFPPIDAAPIRGERVTYEARERRFGALIGRITLGGGDPAQQQRLAALIRRLANAADQLTARSGGEGPAAIFAGLGDTLSHLSARPRPARKLGLPGLQASLRQIADLQPIQLGWSPRPLLSVILPVGRGALPAILDQVYCAARVIEPRRSELILIDDGRVAAVALLPTKLRDLNVVRSADNATAGSSLNTAASVARGDILAFCHPKPIGRYDLVGACDLEAATLALDLDRIARPDANGHSTLSCLIHRADFAALGGFDPGEHGAALQRDLMAKAEALGLAVRDLRTPIDLGARP